MVIYYIRVSLGFLFLGGFCFLAIQHYVFLARHFLLGAKGSMVPFVGAIVGTIGCLLLPFDRISSYWWVCWFADGATFPVVVAGVYHRVVGPVKPENSSPVE